MKKNVFKSLLTVCAFAAAFASCSNENNEVPDVSKETKDVFMKLDLPVPATTKAVDAPLPNTTVAPINSLHVYFYDGGTSNILKHVEITASSVPSISDLATGAKVPSVPVAATKVLVRGNVPSTITMPNSGSITAVENLQVPITTQNDKSNILLGHVAETLTEWHTGDPAIFGVASLNPSDGDKFAAIELEPAVARIEIEGMQGDGIVTGFNLDGIFVNNFYKDLKMGDGTSLGTKEQNGSTPANYAENASGTSYTTANKEKLFDLPNIASVPNALTTKPEVTLTPSTNRWVYHVFANSNTTDANEQLQLVFKLSNLQPSASFGAGSQFLTVRGFKDNLGNFVALEKGKVYTVAMSDFKFDESNLSTVPNVTAVGVYLKVTVKPWEVVAVKPNL